MNKLNKVVSPYEAHIPVREDRQSTIHNHKCKLCRMLVVILIVFMEERKSKENEGEQESGVELQF